MDRINQDPARQRIAMVVEYDGQSFHGWQRQSHVPSVQQSVEEALAKIERCDVRIHAAGRTDAGVHASAMLTHADVSAERWNRSYRAYVQGVNQLLPGSIKILAAKAVKSDFHARFDCTGRRYRYKIWRRSTPSVLMPWRHWWVPRKLDVGAMSEAAEMLLGEHDFSAFRSTGCQAKSPVKIMRESCVLADGDEICFDFSADAFLYHMIRNLVGSLVFVGYGKWTPEHFRAVLNSADNTMAASMAPAQGLYFMNAEYENFSSAELVKSSQYY